jgi:biopolymer transport protein ExbB/TolQ
MEIYNVVVGFFKNGGVFMIPIVIILALGVAIAVERWVYLTITTAKNRALWNTVVPYLKSGNFAGAMQVTSKSHAVIGQIMTYGLNRVRSARRREDIEQAMEESLMEVLPRLEQRTHYLATFANMATLMGLPARSSASSTHSPPCRMPTRRRRPSCSRPASQSA